MAVALLVGGLEAGDQVGRVGLGVAGNRQLEGLPGVAHPVDHLGAGAVETRSRRLAQLLDRGGDPLGAQVLARQHHRAGGVAAAVRGAEAEGGEDAAGARAEQPPGAELFGDRRRVHRAGAAERQQGEAARVDAALDRDDAERPHHLLVGDADDPGGGLQRVQSQFIGQRADRSLAPPRRRGRLRPPGSSRRRGCRAAGWHR